MIYVYRGCCQETSLHAFHVFIYTDQVKHHSDQGADADRIKQRDHDDNQQHGAAGHASVLLNFKETPAQVTQPSPMYTCLLQLCLTLLPCC